jgi:hypothetical protein
MTKLPPSKTTRRNAVRQIQQMPLELRQEVVRRLARAKGVKLTAPAKH